MSSRLATSLCGIPLKNPVLAASGTYAYGIEFADLVDLSAIGGIVVKGLSKDPIEGNPPPRVWETEAGMINSIGLQNIGVRAFIAQKLPALRKFPTPIIANVFGYRQQDYIEVARILEDAEGIAAYELNVSCPNTDHGGMFFSAEPSLLASLVSDVRKVAKRPLIVADMPFGSYQASPAQALETAARFMKEGGARAIKLEGGASVLPQVEALVSAGIPVMGHLGLTPHGSGLDDATRARLPSLGPHAGVAIVARRALRWVDWVRIHDVAHGLVRP